jgi:hypothetical protein
MTLEAPAAEWNWLGPDHVAAPAEALERIGAICELHADLPTAAFVVLATHLGLPREVLATVLKRYRSELQATSVADVVSMLNALQHGGREGFEAVRRTRRKATRAAAAGLPWGGGE